MARTETPAVKNGLDCPDFALPDPSGKLHDRGDLRGVRGLLVVFICNHCPFVRAVADKLAEQGRILMEMGFGVVAISSNDWETHPEDAPEKMAEFAKKHNFPFPYLVDEDQSVAKAFGAVCTPDFFGYNADLELQYRGRLDASGREADPNAESELIPAMRQIAYTGVGPEQQTPSVGCSIKWKDA
ncbi:thioredoxin family protein [Paracoccaceae bacterium GXU_MW_L88]